jgi:hypothetical protein
VSQVVAAFDLRQAHRPPRRSRRTRHPTGRARRRCSP